jgi:metal-responsive CopG/Arc/MetJ family transcriptional regulator
VYALVQAMRTTVTLEDDVAAALARLEKQEGLSPKDVINAAVRSFVAQRSRKRRCTRARRGRRVPVILVDANPLIYAHVASTKEPVQNEPGWTHT